MKKSQLRKIIKEEIKNTLVKENLIDWDYPRGVWDIWFEEMGHANTSESAYLSDQIFEFIEEFYDLTPKPDNPTKEEDINTI